MEVYIKSTGKSFKSLPTIQGAPLCSHLKYAIFDHFSLIFAHCDNIFDKKLLNLPFCFIRKVSRLKLVKALNQQFS